MKKRIESYILIILVSCSLFLDYIAENKTWRHLEWEVIFNSEKARLWLTELILACIIFVCVYIIARYIHKNWKVTLVFTSVIPISLCIYSIYRFHSIWGFIMETQKLIVAIYYLITVYIASQLLHLIRNKLYASILCIIIHVFVILFVCRYPFFYIYSPNPALVLHMAAAFTLSYVYVFWKDSLTLKQSVAYSFIMIIVQTAIFSFHRLSIILDNISSNQSYLNWFLYRGNIINSLTSGLYSQNELDGYALNYTPDYHFVWLGISYSRAFQLLYIVIALLIISLLIYILITEITDNFTRFLLISFIAESIWGFICEVLLIYSVNIGMLFGKNIFMLVHFVLLLYQLNCRKSCAKQWSICSKDQTIVYDSNVQGGIL